MNTQVQTLASVQERVRERIQVSEPGSDAVRPCSVRSFCMTTQSPGSSRKINSSSGRFRMRAKAR